MPVESETEGQRELGRQFEVVVDPGRAILHLGHVAERCREIGAVHLTQYKGSEFVPGRGIQVLAGRVITGSLAGVEIKVASSIHRPAGLREGHVPEFDSCLDRMLAGDPSDVVEKLIAIVDVAPAARPWRAVVGVANRAVEIELGKAGAVEYRLIWQAKPELLIPSHASG